MAIFCYVHPKTKIIIERDFRCGTAPAFIRENGFKCERCLPAELAGQGGQQPSTWPCESIALGVHSSQEKEYNEFAAKNGVPTEHKRGRVIFRSKEHRKRYCELVGATDFDGGFGDPHCD